MFCFLGTFVTLGDYASETRDSQADVLVFFDAEREKRVLKTVKAEMRKKRTNSG